MLFVNFPVAPILSVKNLIIIYLVFNLVYKMMLK